MSPAPFVTFVVQVWIGTHPIAVTRVLLAFAVTLAFSFAAYKMHGVDRGGAIAGAIVAFLLFVFGGPSAFATLVSVFLLTAFTTRMGRDRKRRLGMAEKARGRSAAQVLANLSLAVLFALIGFLYPRFMWAAAAALAEAAADSASSEVGGALTQRVYLVTSMKRVPVGTDGGISLAGSLAGIAAALIVSAVCVVTHWLPPHAFAAIAFSAVAGTLFDSLLGATLQRAGLLTNNGVNWFSTLAAAIIAASLFR